MSISIAEFTGYISQIAVFASIIFVIRQIRQSARHQQATMRHARVQQLQMIYLQASQGDFVEVVTRGLAGDVNMDHNDRTRFIWFSSTMFNMFEDMFDQHRDGIVSARTYASAVASMRSQLAMPGARATWRVIRARYSRDFVDCVDRLLSMTPVESAADPAVAWLRSLADEQEAA